MSVAKQKQYEYLVPTRSYRDARQGPAIKLGPLLALLPPPMALASVLLMLPIAMNVVDWPWWYALTPLVLPLAIGAVALGIIGAALLKSPAP